MFFYNAGMRLYWELAKLSFQRQLTYRAATLAGLATNFFFGLLRAAVLLALLSARPGATDLSNEAAVTFTALSQALIAYLSLFGWYDLMNTVSAGEVATDLLKPMDYFLVWLSRDTGRALTNLLTRGITILIIYDIFFDMVYPQSVSQWLAVFLALILGLLVSFGWRFLVNLASFWTPNASGLGRFAFGMSWVMSGFFMPLRFFPDWFVQLCNLTPFPSMVNTVVEIYLGLLSGRELLLALSTQLLWFVALLIATRLVLRAGISRLVIQGG